MLVANNKRIGKLHTEGCQGTLETVHMIGNTTEGIAHLEIFQMLLVGAQELTIENLRHIPCGLSNLHIYRVIKTSNELNLLHEKIRPDS